MILLELLRRNILSYIAYDDSTNIEINTHWTRVSKTICINRDNMFLISRSIVLSDKVVNYLKRNAKSGAVYITVKEVMDEETYIIE